MLQTLVNRIRGIRSAASMTYRELVADTATNTECRLTDDELERTLACAGKTLEQFEADVSVIAARQQAAEDLETAARMEAGVNQAEVESRQAREVYQATVARHKAELLAADRTWKAAIDRAGQLRGEMLHLRQDAEQTLRRTAPGSIDRQIAELDARIELIQQQQRAPYSAPIVNPPLGEVRAGMLPENPPVQDETGARPWLTSRPIAKEDPARAANVADQRAAQQAERQKHLAGLQNELHDLQERRQQLEDSKLEV